MGQFDTEGTSSEGLCIKAGRYHFSAVSAQEKLDGDKPQVIVECEVLAGENTEMKGRKQKEFFRVDNEVGISRLLKFACAIGLYNKKQWDADKAAGRSADIGFESNVTGRQFVGKIVEEEYPIGSSKYYSRLNFDIWPLVADEAKGTPMDLEMLGMIGLTVGPDGRVVSRGTAGQSAAQPAPQQQQPVSDDIAAGF